ncbi:MAG TPA: family 78 glycoside hydrolase catalytic domain [Bacteroidales bacterium]|nr:family 78 glycoside hydrolase catalytic domain [Bacteroidales bacterium]HNR41539.1 family 78 glycoside hydrolase catalytic domain [Bacteroidales bacterium]HPM18135.1 family 78 glycoside hydrolase catalytic domain [Bacteroidales bacterium]
MKRTVCLFLISILISVSCSHDIHSGIRIGNLKCNNLTDPAGIDSIPSFSWIPESVTRGAGQSAYQIILDRNINRLKQERTCLWNSGKIVSPETAWIVYSGPPLEPSEKYFWKVRIWDQDDAVTEWSDAAFFITGLFADMNWKGAEWIANEVLPDSLLLVPGVHGNGDDLGNIALKRTVIPYFRKEFNTGKKISQAYVFISGLGHYELHINGRKIGDRFLSPGWTNYDKTCLYNTYDVTKELKQGTNALGVIVGNGFYNINRERYRKLVIAYDAPKMIMALRIRYSDGSAETIVSDGSWKTAPSPITYSGIFGGEDYDARFEQDGWSEPGFDDSGWNSVLTARRPKGVLRPEADYPLRVMEAFDDAQATRLSDTMFLYDFGQNASGIVKLKVKGVKGRTVKLIPGELIDDRSNVTQKASGFPYFFTYTLKGSGEEIWSPRFTYYGFRYVQVEGAVPAGNPNPHDLPVITGLELLHTRNSSPPAGSFNCSDSLFNSIYKLISWAIKSNLASVATDCPHREKLGWLEQTHLMGNSIRYNFDIRNLYSKIIDDMAGAQLENGLVPDIAPEYVPFYAGFRDSPEWGSACTILPWQMYEWYGDLGAVKKAYPMMKKYVGYLESRADRYLLSHGLGDWYDLGPKFPGEAQLTPKALTATSIWYHDVDLLARMAGLTGNTDDQAHYRKLAGNIREAFNKEFFNPETKVYSTGSQTAYSMPLYFGMVDPACIPEVTENLVSSVIAGNKALTAGDIGYRYLLRVLEQGGHSQLIYEMNSRTDVPGYGYQLSRGATSLTESWAALRDVSNNHMMLGHLMEWFYSGLGGIRQIPGSRACDSIFICPEPVKGIDRAETTYLSIRGEIRTSWKISENTFTLKVKIPMGCRATISLPGTDPGRITEDDTSIFSSSHVKVRGTGNGRVLCEVPSGEYNFKTTF